MPDWRTRRRRLMDAVRSHESPMGLDFGAHFPGVTQQSDQKRTADAMHRVEVFFATRLKAGIRFYVAESRPVDETTGLRCDQTIRLNSRNGKKAYPESLRLISCVGPESGVHCLGWAFSRFADRGTGALPRRPKPGPKSINRPPVRKARSQTGCDDGRRQAASLGPHSRRP